MSQTEMLKELFDAVQVLRLTPAVREFLLANDPQALAQADNAAIQAMHAKPSLAKGI